MNIVVVTPQWPPVGRPNGIVTYYSNLVPALRNLGHRVFVISLASIEPTSEPDVFYCDRSIDRISESVVSLVDKLRKGFKGYYLGAKALINTIKQIQSQHLVDIVQMEDSFGWHYLVQKAISVPVVMRLHGPHFLNNFDEDVSRQSRLRLGREKRAFLSARYVSAPSRNVMELTRAKYACNWKVSAVVPNSIPYNDNNVNWHLDNIVRNQILYVGRFDNHKGADILIDSLYDLYSNNQKVTLVFIGPDRGLIKDGKKYSLDQYLECFHSHWPVKDVLKVLGPQDRDVIDYYRLASHITVVPSRYETFGNVALEAMAVGSPLVCTDSGALPEIVLDGETGVLFSSENAKDLFDKICFLLADDDLCQKISNAAIQRIKLEYSPEHLAKLLISFFESVTSEHSKRAHL